MGWGLVGMGRGWEGDGWVEWGGVCRKYGERREEVGREMMRVGDCMINEDVRNREKNGEGENERERKRER